MELNTFSLYLVTDRDCIGEKGLQNVVDRAVKGGITAIQLREKNEPTRAFVELARSVKQCLKGTKIPLIINDRIDVALASGANGIHVGQSDMHYGDAMEIVPKKFIIGVTIDTPEQITETNHYPLSYVCISSVFQTQTKEVKHTWSQGEVLEVRSLSKHPLLGIGGINPQNAKTALSWGLEGLAIVSSICAAPSISEVEAQTLTFRKIMEEHHALQ